MKSFFSSITDIILRCCRGRDHHALLCFSRTLSLCNYCCRSWSSVWLFFVEKRIACFEDSSEFSLLKKKKKLQDFVRFGLVAVV